MLITEVKPGDVIKEGHGKSIEVKQVENNACSSRGTHINNKYCYEPTAHVTVSREFDIDANRFVDSALGDLEEDFDPGVLV